VARQEQAEGAPVLHLVQDPDLGGESRLPLLHPPLRLFELGRQRLLSRDQAVQRGLVLAQARVVLQQHRVELAQDPLEPDDPSLGRSQLVFDIRLVGVDLGELGLVALDLGLEVIDGVGMRRAGEESDQQAEDGGCCGGSDGSMSHLVSGTTRYDVDFRRQYQRSGAGAQLLRASFSRLEMQARWK
jgi:hypothetical protein